MGAPVQAVERWEEYEKSFSMMDELRNSYSKTDRNITFMHLKEDHVRNGQLKPAYNVQIAVNSEYITGIEAFSDRTDVRTLKPFLHLRTAGGLPPGTVRGSSGGRRV